MVSNYSNLLKSLIYTWADMGVSENRGTLKWMVYDGKPDFLMDDLGVPLFLETPISPFKMNKKKQSKLRKSQYLTVTLQDQLLPKKKWGS